METLIVYLKSSHTLTSIYTSFFKWQTLLGSLLGPLLAFYAALIYQSRMDGRENIRRTEIVLSRVLNDIYESREALNNFLVRLKGTIKSINLNDEKFFMYRGTFPNKNIFMDEQLSVLKLHSLYLHNKLMWIEAGVRNINISLNEMYESFTAILNDSRDNAGKMKPVDQKYLLLQELNGFYKWVEELLKYYNAGIKILAQAKIYNLMLKDQGRRSIIHKYEKLPFKYYLKTYKFKKDYISVFTMQKRIDDIIEPDVVEIIDEAERRLQERITK